MTVLNTTPRYKISPYLFMQFMEPLGATDGSVDAAWNFETNDWRPEVIDIVSKLAPPMIRWGGIYTSFWKWREGIGPRDKRIPAINYLWGGIESNQVGIDEFLDFCRRVGADPLIGVNFAADGRPQYIETGNGERRAGTAEEAADLVRYCNDPDHPERKANGQDAPWAIRHWQIGNETSYPATGKRFTKEENANHYLEFAKAMRAADPSIKLVGWGDQDREAGEWWAGTLLDVAGDYVDYVALHMMHQRPQRDDTILVGMEYTKDRDRAWEELLEIFATIEPKIVAMKEIIDSKNSSAKIAITEGHLSIRPHNANFLLHEWLGGLYHAKVFNLFQRHGDKVEIATAADFLGNKWTVNAVMMGGMGEKPYLMPVGVISELYSKHIGEDGLEAPSVNGLDIAASRTGDRIFLHVVNDDLHKSKELELDLSGRKITGGQIYQICPEDVSVYVDPQHPNALDAQVFPAEPAEKLKATIPAASVTIFELDTESASS